ncbi:MAG: two component transcriptional regulator, winged helix family [Dehalococcoidia bacterium]|nr:two component transcriptional regulator, winged helix family [Dehalococcoidia bacterium]
MGISILIIGEDVHISSHLEKWLKQHSFITACATDPAEGMRIFYDSRPNLVILDIGIPTPVYWQVCKTIRILCDVPIIIISDSNLKSDIIESFRMGADDYLTKPFDLKELIERVKAILRRCKNSNNMEAEQLDCSGLHIDFNTHTVSVFNQVKKLSPIEFNLLACLARNRNKVVSHRKLLENIWGADYVEERGYVKLYIRYLRRKIEQNPSNPKRILSERGFGYRLVAET